MTTTALAEAQPLALMPDFLDPIKLIGYFGAWALVGLLVVVFIESGVLFPVLPGDTLLFVAGMLAAGTSRRGDRPTSSCGSCWCSSRSPPSSADRSATSSAGIIGTAMFKPDARVLKQRYLDEAHAFFEQRGPVRHRASPASCRSCGRWRRSPRARRRMSYGVFTLFNVIGAVAWGVGLTLLGYGLGQFEIIQKLLEPIFILIALASVMPMVIEWYKRRRAAKRARATNPPPKS